MKEQLKSIVTSFVERLKVLLTEPVKLAGAVLMVLVLIDVVRIGQSGYIEYIFTATKSFLEIAGPYLWHAVVTLAIFLLLK